MLLKDEKRIRIINYSDDNLFLYILFENLNVISNDITPY